MVYALVAVDFTHAYRKDTIFDDLSTLPRSQQDKILDIISAYLAQHMRKAG